MKRLIWTLAMAVAGFGLGWHSQGAPSDRGNVATATIWAACIGFGFGSIFDKRRPRKGLLVFYWAFTLALIGGKRLSNTPVRQAGGCVEVSRCPQKQSYQRPSDVPVRKFRSWWLSLLAAVCGGASFVGIGV